MAALTVWGFIIRLVVNTLKGSPVEVIASRPRVHIKESLLQHANEKDPLLLDYPDPFLKNEPQSLRLPVKAAFHTPVPIPPAQDFSFVRFEGFIAGKKNHLIILVSIHGIEHMAEVGQTIDNITLTGCQEESLTIYIQHTTVKIKRE